MRRRVILVAVLTFILVLASPQSACSSESSQPYWLVDSEEDWYEGDMVYSFCNDTDALHFTGEKVLFEDGFTWTVEEDAPWTILRIDKNKDEILDMKLDSNPAPSMIKFEASGAVPKGDTIRLVLWGDDSVESPIDISKHAYEVIWKVRLNVDEGMDLWEILIIVNRSDRILYDY